MVVVASHGRTWADDIPVILQVAGALAALLGPFHGPRPFGAAASSVQIGFANLSFTRITYLSKLIGMK
ncbi:hypothetical protein DWV07_15395 [Dickeya zeae]|nr:hypothetical protein DWV07_15395 [Dickeya zeae]